MAPSEPLGTTVILHRFTSADVDDPDVSRQRSGAAGLEPDLVLARSLSPSIAVFLAAEIAVAPLGVSQMQSALVLRGMVYGHDQGRSVSPAPIGVRNSRAL